MSDSAPFFDRLRHRKVVQWTLVYVAGAWLVLEVTAFLSDTFDWSPFLVRSLTVVAAVGLVATLVLAWFHGERGEQRVTRPEMAILGTLALVAAAGVAVLGPVGETPDGPAGASDGAADSGAPLAPAGSAPGPSGPGVAVLPFQTLGGEPDDDYFGVGMADEIIAHLSRLDGLLVIARQSAAPYAGESPATVARALGVSHVLTGSVQRSAGSVRIRAALVDPSTGAQVWGERFEEDWTDLFSIQSRVARAVAAALDVVVTDAQAERIDRDPTESEDAYELFLRGRQAWSRRTGPAIDSAITLFTRAVELDPEYADAWAALSTTYAILPGYTSVLPASAYPQGLAAADRALALDSTLAEAHTARGFMRMMDWPAPRVEAEFRRAVELSPGFATGHQWYGVYLISRGRFAEADERIRLAARLDPEALVIATEIGWPDYHAGRFEEALAAFEAVLREHPDFELAWEFTWGARELSGAYAEAAEAAHRTVVLKGQPAQVGAEIERDLKTAYESGGAAGYWRERLRWVERLGRGSTFLTTANHTAGIYARAGDIDGAFATLERGLEEGDPFFFFLGVDPALDPLRDDPRFASILNRSGLPPIDAR